MSARFLVGRRDFLQLLGGVVVVAATGTGEGQESGRTESAGAADADLSAWLHVAEDGTVTVYTGKVEFGQNIRTSLAQAVAEELRAPLATIQLVMGDTDRTPFDMGTFGSRTPRPWLRCFARPPPSRGRCSRTSRPSNGTWTRPRSSWPRDA